MKNARAKRAKLFFIVKFANVERSCLLKLLNEGRSTISPRHSVASLTRSNTNKRSPATLADSDKLCFASIFTERIATEKQLLGTRN